MMNSTATLERNRTRAASEPQASPRAKDDAEMLKAAASLTRDLNVPNERIYWADMLGSALLGYGALLGAMLADQTWFAAGLGIVAVLALYRAGSFIHELTHIKKGAVKGFRLIWNLVVGVPLMVPSFMYEGVHNQHHAKRYYGTADDPEYLPLALMHPWTLPLFLVAAALAPIGMLIRFGVLAPVSLLSPKLRNIAANPRVALHLDGDDLGGDLVILQGTARVSDDPSADQVPSYVEKYRARMTRNGWSPADFAGMYSVPLRIDPTRLRGH